MKTPLASKDNVVLCRKGGYKFVLAYFVFSWEKWSSLEVTLYIQ